MTRPARKPQWGSRLREPVRASGWTLGEVQNSCYDLYDSNVRFSKVSEVSSTSLRVRMILLPLAPHQREGLPVSDAYTYPVLAVSVNRAHPSHGSQQVGHIGQFPQQLPLSLVARDHIAV